MYMAMRARDLGSCKKATESIDVDKPDYEEEDRHTR